MSNHKTKYFTHSHHLNEDGSLSFLCAEDGWSWHGLDPYDPIVIQSINFYASVEAGAARGTFDISKWSALTQMDWSCGNGKGHAARGVIDALDSDESPKFSMTFFDADDVILYQMGGTGVVFKNRDFNKWRETSKKQVKTPLKASDFTYAQAADSGKKSKVEVFLGAVIEDKAIGLITDENGFTPNHPYITGSGDHVNATHLADICHQLIRQRHGSGDFVIMNGDMRFKHYVELGQIFEIVLTKSLSNCQLSFEIRQNDKICALADIEYQVK